ncbi:hypothetical protein SFRURICE_011053 [Spodoptera frugiperda]|nr:hypothetical protein SFRURICE_011053 [Spodoptera frugiperda]
MIDGFGTSPVISDTPEPTKQPPHTPPTPLRPKNAANPVRGYVYWASGIAGRSPPTLSAGLRTASKGSSPLDQNQTRACGTSRSARASKSHQSTTDRD